MLFANALVVCSCRPSKALFYWFIKCLKFKSSVQKHFIQPKYFLKTNWAVAIKIMEAKFELVPTGVNELEEKLKKAQILLSELKKLIDEIKDCQVAFTLKPC